MGPLCCKEYMFYTKQNTEQIKIKTKQNTEQIKIKIKVSELLFLMTEIIQLYHLPYTPIFMVLKMIVKTQQSFFNFRWL